MRVASERNLVLGVNWCVAVVFVLALPLQTT